MDERMGETELYSFRGKLVAAYWQSASVRDRSIRSLLETLRVRLPNVNAIAVKTNSGHQWMGEISGSNRRSDLDIHNADDVARWADACASLKLDCISWCVVHGAFPVKEAKVIAEVCAVPGISAMVLDVEAGHSYFRGDRETARYLARTIRESAPNKHIGLCFDARGQHPEQIYIQEWLPYMTGLHPMVYPETFRRDPVLAVRDAFAVLAKYKNYLDLPVTVWVGAHSLKDTGSLLRAVPTIFEQNTRAQGLVLWRYGDDVMRSKEFATIRQLTIPYHIAASRPLGLHLKAPSITLRDGLYTVARRMQIRRILRRFKSMLKSILSG